MASDQISNSWTVLWEDNDLLAVAKPVGLVVDSGRGENDLVSAVGGGVFAFHRLDRETSGLVLLGKTRRYAKDVTAMFEEKRIRKAYMAVVEGEWTASRVDAAVDGRPATTTFRRLALGDYKGRVASWVEALPKTGRTHQIRLHCANSGHAILGDQRYGQNVQASEHGQALHAYRLDFRHPASGDTVIIQAPPTEWRSTWLEHFDFETVWKKVAGRASS